MQYFFISQLFHLPIQTIQPFRIPTHNPQDIIIITDIQLTLYTQSHLIFDMGDIVSRTKQTKEQFEELLGYIDRHQLQTTLLSVIQLKFKRQTSPIRKYRYICDLLDKIQQNLKQDSSAKNKSQLERIQILIQQNQSLKGQKISNYELYSSQLQDLKNQIQKKEGHISKLTQENRILYLSKKQLATKYEQQHSQSEILKLQVDKSKKQIQKIQSQFYQAKKQVDSEKNLTELLKNEITHKDQQIEELVQLNQQLLQNFLKINQQIKRNHNEKKQNFQRYMQQHDRTRGQLAKKKEQNQQLKAIVTDKDTIIKRKDQQINHYKHQVHQLNKSLDTQKQRNRQLQQKKQQSDKLHRQREQQLERQITQVRQREQDLSKIIKNDQALEQSYKRMKQCKGSQERLAKNEAGQQKIMKLINDCQWELQKIINQGSKSLRESNRAMIYQ